MEVDQIVRNFVEIELHDDNSFLIVKETLTRIGLRSKSYADDRPKLFQSCHILNKRGKTYIVHFKEMFLLDNKSTSFDNDDLMRRNTIAKLLEKWNLIKVINRDSIEPAFDVDEAIKSGKLYLLPFKEKSNWILEPKYNIGKHKRKSFDEE